MRRLLCLFLALGLAAVLSSCDTSVTPYAAQVDGTTITKGALQSTMSEIAANSGLRCVEMSESGSSSIDGAAKGSYATPFAASELTFLINGVLVQSAVQHLGLGEPAVARSAAIDELEQAFSPASGSACTATGQSVYLSLAPSLRSAILDNELDQDVLSAHLAGASLSPAGIAAYGRTHAGATDLRCVSALLVSTKAKADELHSAIVGGASFAVVAKANSLDTESAPSGGALGCLSLGDFASPLDTDIAKLPTGALSSVISFSGSFVILEVTGRKPASSLQVVEAMSAAGKTAEGSYLEGLGATANVAVDPSYGTWTRSGATFVVRPPSGPADKLLPNPSAVAPPVITAGNS